MRNARKREKTMTEFCEYTTPLTADEMTALAVIVNDETGITTCKHPHVVCEDRWVLKNLDIFQKVYLVTDPADVPKWFNDMFLEIMDRLLYDCECDDLPEILVNVRDYISGLSRPVGKE